MFDWFRRKSGKTQEETIANIPIFHRVVTGAALAAAIDQACKNYPLGLPPAYTRRTNARDMWEGTRTEAMLKFRRHGKATLTVMTELTMQAKLFAEIVSGDAEADGDKSNGEVIHDAVQAIFVTFKHLHATSYAANAQSKTEWDYVRPFRKLSKELAPKWAEYERAITKGETPLPELPPLLLTVFWEEVSAKSKQIGLAPVWGSDLEYAKSNDLAMIEQKLGTSGKSRRAIDKELAECAAVFDKMIAAKDPDDLL